VTAALHVATLNIRNLADRWAERQSLIYADMAALQPDLLGLQEVVYPLQQDRLIGAAGEGRYREIRAWAGRPEYGNSLLVRQPLTPDDAERIDLGLNRSALRVRLRLNESNELLFAVTHLHHEVPDADIRDRQADELLGWLAAARPATATVVVGDFNANPTEPAYRRISDAGFRSAHREANGSEPAVTWPSGLVAPAMDTDGVPACLDYIWVRGAIGVVDCRLVFDRPDPNDTTLLPSDHFGLSAHLEIG
jgi:endonuclease/exonuclease/phosphatase family metal-dependent hydrolase